MGYPLFVGACLTGKAALRAQHVASCESAARLASSSAADNMGSYDHLYEKDKISKKPGDPNKRDFTYFVLGGARFVYASAARLIALKVGSTTAMPVLSPT